jgi:hypothetical protein
MEVCHFDNTFSLFKSWAFVVVTFVTVAATVNTSGGACNGVLVRFTTFLAVGPFGVASIRGVSALVSSRFYICRGLGWILGLSGSLRKSLSCQKQTSRRLAG